MGKHKNVSAFVCKMSGKNGRCNVPVYDTKAIADCPHHFVAQEKTLWNQNSMYRKGDAELLQTGTRAWVEGDGPE